MSLWFLVFFLFFLFFFFFGQDLNVSQAVQLAVTMQQDDNFQYSIPGFCGVEIKPRALIVLRKHFSSLAIFFTPKIALMVLFLSICFWCDCGMCIFVSTRIQRVGLSYPAAQLPVSTFHSRLQSCKSWGLNFRPHAYKTSTFTYFSIP